MSHAVVKSAPRRPLAWIGRAFDFVFGVADAYTVLRQAARERRELLALGERDLRDIGISRADAVREADRPLWHSIAGRGDGWPIGRA